MPEKELHVSDPPLEEGQREALKSDENPALTGQGDLSYLCGGCGATVAENISQGQIFDLGIIGAECETFNDTPSAIGGKVSGSPVYFPVGTYRISEPVEVPTGVLVVGEPFLGAGPPEQEG